MSSYIQIPFGYKEKQKDLQFNLPKNNYENRLLQKAGYIKDSDDPKIINNLLQAIKSREDLQKFILATSDVGNELQESINTITSGDEKFNNAVVRRALDLKNNDVFRNPQPITVVFDDVKRFHQQNPIIGKLASQIQSQNLTEKDQIKREFLKGDIAQIENRLANLRDPNVNPFPINKNNRNNNNNDDEGGSDDDSDNDDNNNSGIPPPETFGLRIGKLREKIAEMDPSYKKQKPERDLQETFKKLRYGRPIPPNDDPPPDPFSPDFWHKVSDDPKETAEAKLDDNLTKQREDLSREAPPPPLFEPIKRTFAPITRTMEGEKIVIHHTTEEVNEEKQLSDRLEELFPNINEIDSKENADMILHYENLSETLSAIEPTAIMPFEFEFFKGGANPQFEEIINSLTEINEDTTEFINFLQGNICKNILENNKLKIHLESGNIFYDNENTNESIHSFILAQNNEMSGTIKNNLSYDRDYKTYFQWISSAFNETEKNKLDILTNLNSKFLFYRFNDFLQQKGQKTKSVKHSVVTDDYIAGEKIQDKSWKYFIESIFDFSEKPNSNYTDQSFLTDTKENLEILKKTYNQLFMQIEKNQIEMLKQMPFDFYEDIKNDLMRDLYLEEDFEKLDTWVSFYYKNGRIPGNQELTILPQSNKPKTVDSLSTEASPLELYKKYGRTSLKNVVSFQAIVALFLYHGGDILTAKKAMEEWKNNLTFQTLSGESSKEQISFEKITNIVLHLLGEYEKLKEYFNEYRKKQSEKTIKKITSTPIKSYKPTKLSINDTPISDESSFLKTAITLEQTNINATIEKEEEDNREIIKSIIDPTPGAIVTETANRNFFEDREEDESRFKLGNSAQKRLDTILDNLDQSIKLPSSTKQKTYIAETEAGNKIETEQKEIVIKKAPDFTFVITRPKRRHIERSPYNLRRKVILKKLNKPITFTVDDNEEKKVERIEKLIDSVVSRSGLD